jgi:hypothetical protein
MNLLIKRGFSRPQRRKLGLERARLGWDVLAPELWEKRPATGRTIVGER